jgi:hypothetical protein
MEKICWTDRVNNETVLHRVKEQSNLLHTHTREKKKKKWEEQLHWTYIAQELPSRSYHSMKDYRDKKARKETSAVVG